MQGKPVWEPVLMLIASLGAGGCVTDDDPHSCGDPDAYTPYATTLLPKGEVIALPWRGPRSSYPNGREAFDVYGASASIECGSSRDHRSHLDVTAGCLTAAAMGDGAYHRAHVSLTDPGANPGFKVFARYRTEDDLYVGSSRLDGVVQIQKKQCGDYTILARLEGQPPPSTNTWHRIRFAAVGTQLALYLDDELALTAEDDAFSWGTVGIRIDGVAGAYLDDWRVF